MIQKIFSYSGHILGPSLIFSFIIPLLIPTNVRAQLPEKIAVLPFKIYAPEPMDHLILELQEMLGARLMGEGFDLVDPAVINNSKLSK